MITDANYSYIQRRLQPAHDRLICAWQQALVVHAVEWSLRIAMAALVLFALVQVVLHLAQSPLRLPIAGTLVFSVFVGIIAGAAWTWRSRPDRPELRHAAERLDAATNKHNLVATALCMSQWELISGFAHAAVVDGVRQLEQIAERDPVIDRHPFAWRYAGQFAVALFVSGLVLWSAGTAPEPTSPDTPTAGSLAVQLSESGDAAPDKSLDPEKKQTPVLQPHQATQTASVEQSLANQNGKGGRESRGQLASQSASGGKPNRQLRADAAGASANNAQGSQPRRAQKDKKEQPQERKGTPPKQRPQSAVTMDQVASVSQGMSGRGGKPAADHTWTHSDRSAQSELEEDQGDEDVEDQAESNTQRGGIQPHLKDRNEAPSRDLGMSSDQGKPGTGRGGPTPPKKARGVASLVLGIALPDFVKGRLGPGTNKITHDKAEPLAAANPSLPSASNLAERAQETPQSRYHPASAEAAAVRSYFELLHHPQNGAASD